MKKISYLMILILFSFSAYSQKKEIEMYCTYLKEHGQSPKDYIISKFKDYDYVFLGEQHRIKQDVDFVTSLICDLYKNGVRNIAYEFYEYQNQTILDSVLTAKEWNEKLLYHHISSGFAIYWGYTEYLDLLKNVWKYNQTLEPNQPKFRVVLLGPEWNPCREDDPPFGTDIDPDKFMADVFEKEIISKNEKALVYCGIHHAFTKYRQPNYDFEQGKLISLGDGRLGNVINRKCHEKTFTIFLHSPWTSNKGWDKQRVRPVNGSIDSIMSKLGNFPMAFETKNTVMGKLTADDTYYAFGHENFKLEDFCDGYIFLVPYKEMKFVSPEPNFYDDYNLDRYKKMMKCRGASEEEIRKITKKNVLKRITERPAHHFGNLMK